MLPGGTSGAQFTTKSTSRAVPGNPGRLFFYIQNKRLCGKCVRCRAGYSLTARSIWGQLIPNFGIRIRSCPHSPHCTESPKRQADSENPTLLRWGNCFTFELRRVFSPFWHDTPPRPLSTFSDMSAIAGLNPLARNGRILKRQNTKIYIKLTRWLAC